MIMKLGIISDTHDDRANALPYIIRELIKRGVDQIIHCGDIEPKHINSSLFNGLPVTCAINFEQHKKIDIKNPPAGWAYTTHTKDNHETRIRDIDHIRCYIGHKFSSRLLLEPQTAFMKGIDELRTNFDGLRWIFAGHTHHQIFTQDALVNFINPGAVCDSINNSHEFAILDTNTGEVTFSRILRTTPIEPDFSVGIISDSLQISKIDGDFWKKLSIELKNKNVTHIIHCGNIASEDIGRSELDEFQVHYYSRVPATQRPGNNWHAINKNRPLININGRQFYLHTILARILLEESEVEMHKECLKILENHPEVSFVLYGGTNNAFLNEGQQARIFSPGDAFSSRGYGVIKFPVTEIVLGHVPLNPFPPIQ